MCDLAYQVHPDDAKEAKDSPRENDVDKYIEHPGITAKVAPPTQVPEDSAPGVVQRSVPVTTEDHVDTVPGHEDVVICKDLDDACATWAKSGECQANPEYMRDTCARSCGICNGGKGFVQPDPQDAQEEGSIDSSSPCDDSDVACGEWAQAGECEKNRDYMRTACRKACGLCE